MTPRGHDRPDRIVHAIAPLIAAALVAVLVVTLYVIGTVANDPSGCSRWLGCTRSPSPGPRTSPSR